MDLLTPSLGFTYACSSGSGMFHYGPEFTGGYLLQRTGNLPDYALKYLPKASYSMVSCFQFTLSLKFQIKCPETL